MSSGIDLGALRSSSAHTLASRPQQMIARGEAPEIDAALDQLDGER
jgi:hypothetical protein